MAALHDLHVQVRHDANETLVKSVHVKTLNILILIFVKAVYFHFVKADPRI